MAQLNTFKSLQHSFVGSDAGLVNGVEPQIIYTAPAGYTAIILNAQAANVATPAADVAVTLKLIKGTAESILVNEIIIPPNDAANLATGKLVLQAGDKLYGFVRPTDISNSSTSEALDLTLSFLETLDA